MKNRSIAIMQPYFFPYIGYYQLFNAADEFVFYDDVNFIKRGWINRNNFLIQGNQKKITIPVEKASQNNLIMNTYSALNDAEGSKILKNIEISYNKAPHFEEVFQIFRNVIDISTKKTPISEVAAMSITLVAKYLNLSTQVSYSSKKFHESKGLEKADRLISICKKRGIHNYLNAINGKELYSKDYFTSRDINLKFIQPKFIQYQQLSDNYIGNLSIIDVLMFNSVNETKDLLTKYSIH
jgi:hypothetical protein